MIYVKNTRTGLVYEFEDETLPDLCLELKGGGRTERKVAEAMVLRSEVNSGKVMTVGRFVIQKTEG